MNIALIVLGVVVGTVALYLLIVALAPGISAPQQSLNSSSTPSKSANGKAAGPWANVTFQAGGAIINAWLFRPENAPSPVPCVVMGHGFGGTKDFGLDTYAVRFQEAGFAVLVFDYRYFGESGGDPRQLIWIPRQLEDWAAAIEYARGLENVDPAKIALWGSSLGGGHAIVMAARDHRVACVAAQCPGLDGKASSELAFKRIGLGLGLRMIVHAQRDLVRSWLGLTPHRIPIVGKPGSIAFFTTPDAYEMFGKIAPEGFINEACARIAIKADTYRPVKHARHVRCPVLLQICEKDTITPLSAAEETIANLGEYAEVKRYPVGHFEIYFGENFERSVTDQVAFFKKYL